jgi:hypothetical protein
MSNNREPSKHKLGNEPLVHIATAPNEVVAQMWVEILKDDGIHCSMKMGTATGDFLSLFTRMGVPVEIHVLASEAQKAEEILASLEESPADTD